MLSKTNSKPRSNRQPKKHSIESLEARQLFAVDLLAVSTHGDTAPVILGSADLVDPIAQAAPDAPLLVHHEAPPQVIVEDPLPVEEGKKVKFTIRLSRAYDVPVRVHYRTVNGSAFGSQAMDTGDFNATDRNSSIVFLPGQTDKTVTVRTNDDDVAEIPEKFRLEVWSVASPRPIGWAKRVGVATILDNDGGPGPQVIVDDAEPVEEGNAVQFKIRLTEPSDKPVRVKYRTGDGSAIGTQVVGEGDYLSTDRSNTLVFRPGETEKTVVVETNDDAIVEDREQFTLQVHRVSSKRAVGIEDASGIGTILDNDGENRQAPPDAGPQDEPGEPVKDIDWGDINGNLDDIIWSCGTVDDMFEQAIAQLIADSLIPQRPLSAMQILAGGSPNVDWSVSWERGLFDGLSDEQVVEEYRYYAEALQNEVLGSTADIELRLERLEGEAINRRIDLHSNDAQPGHGVREEDGSTNYADQFTAEQIERAKTAPVTVSVAQRQTSICETHALHSLISTYAAEHGGDVPTIQNLLDTALEKDWIRFLGDDEQEPNAGDLTVLDRHLVDLASEVGWELSKLPDNNRAVAWDAMQREVDNGNPVMIRYRANTDGDPVAANQEGGNLHWGMVQGFFRRGDEMYVVGKQPHSNEDLVWKVSDLRSSWDSSGGMYVVSGQNTE